MKQTIGNLLLVLGVVVGALAAADAKRAFRVVSLDEAQGDFLFRDLVDASDELVAKAGAEITPEVVGFLRGQGAEHVRVTFPARPDETVPIEAALGRVLSQPVTLDAAVKTETLNKGRVIDADLVQRARDAGVELPVEEGAVLPEPPSEGEAADEEPASEAPSAAEEERSDAAAAEVPEEKPEAVRLQADVELPFQLRTNYYVDKDTVELLRKSGISEVGVKIPPRFHFGDWRGRWYFLLAMLAMVAGAMLKRVRPGGGGALDEETVQGTAALFSRLDELERGVRGMIARLDELDAHALHDELDPLLTGPAYEFLEGRDHIRSAHGLTAYAQVMGPWAGAERKLHRAWSAAVDGHVEEARQSVRDSLPFIEETRAAMPGGPPAARS
jgi:hypothetical protein